MVQAKKTADGPSIAVVGVTGAVGQEFLQVRGRGLFWLLLHRAWASFIQFMASQVLKERNFPYKSMKLLASAR